MDFLPSIPPTAQAAAIGVENLYRAGALEVHNLPKISLENEIHKLFERCAFPNLTDAMYEQLRPVLLLASMFLSHPVCSDWWVRLCLASQLEDQENGISYLSEINITDEMRALTVKLLRYVSTYIFFYLDDEPERTHGNTYFFKRKESLAELLGVESDDDDEPEFFYAKIRLNRQFSEWLQYEVDVSPLGLRYRTYFCMAVTLVHELAHAVHGIRFRLLSIDEFDRFCFNITDPETEIGLAWENDTFGSLPLVSTSDDETEDWTAIPYWGVFSWKWNARRGSDSAVAYPVPTAWVAKLFTKEFWEHTVEELRTEIQLPRSGLGTVENEQGEWLAIQNEVE